MCGRGNVAFVNSREHTFVVTSLVATLALLLAGCQSSVPEPTESPAPTVVESVAPTPTEAAPAGDYYPFAADCAELMPDQVIFGFNPNYVLDNSAATASASSADLVKAMEGTTCNFVNQSSQAALTISVAHLTPISIQVLEEQAASSFSSIEVGGQSAFFGTVAGSGILQVFTGNDFWYTVAGPEVSAPEDVVGITDQLDGFLAAQ